MVRLHPYPEPFHQCPSCKVLLSVTGWYIPGMRTLAQLCCQQCDREFYGDLLSGHGLYCPMLLDKQSGDVHDIGQGCDWFATWLRNSYAQRQSAEVGFTTEVFCPVKRPLLLNCLDALYGHSLLKLLNAQHYIDNSREYDIILLIPHFLRWMVPDGVAAIWTVDLPLRRGLEWNDWLAAELRRRLERFDEVWLSVAFSHPHPQDFGVERFTRVRPFALDDWEARIDRPTVCWVWREDRPWLDEPSPMTKLVNRIQTRGARPQQLQRQTARVLAFFTELRRQIPKLQGAIAGIGEPGGLPSWITDLRTKQVDDQVERRWCEQYARSQVVVGIHGSNMLLPSGHAGATVELVPPDRWGNILQDFLFKPHDLRLATLLYRTLPSAVGLTDLAGVVTSLMLTVSFYKLTMGRDCLLHQSPEISEIPDKFRSARNVYVSLSH